MLFPHFLSVIQKELILSEPDSFLTSCMYMRILAVALLCCSFPGTTTCQMPSLCLVCYSYYYLTTISEAVEEEEGGEHRPWRRSAWVRSLLHYQEVVEPCRFPKHSIPQFPHQENRDDNIGWQ